ncbi:hypothetical protein [Caballeronia sp. KNU42]
MEKLTDQPFVRAFLHAGKFQDDPVQFADAPATGEVAAAIQEAVTAASKEDAALQRLSELFETGRVRPLSTLISTDSLTPDYEVLSQAHSQLSSLRPLRGDDVNYIDAHNYAMTCALNNRFYDSDQPYFFLLITSSRVPLRVFERITWDADPLFETGDQFLVRTSLARRPELAIYYARLMRYGERATRITEEAESELKHLHARINNVEKSSRPIPHRHEGRSNFHLPLNQDVLRSIIRFDALYTNVYRPVIELITSDTSRELNRRSLRKIELGGLEQEALSSTGQAINLNYAGDLSVSPTYRTTLETFDKIIAKTKYIASKLNKDFKQFSRKAVADLDPEGLILSQDHLDVSKKVADDITEITVRFKTEGSGSGPLLFCADAFKDHASVWWPTNVDMRDFLKASRLFIESAVEWMKIHHSLEVLEKEYHGVYFVLSDRVIHKAVDNLPFDLPLEELVPGLLESEWDLRAIRIALDVGDFYYDLDSTNTVPQCIRLTTHLRCASAISTFIQNTHVKHAQRRALTNAIIRTLPAVS